MVPFDSLNKGDFVLIIIKNFFKLVRFFTLYEYFRTIRNFHFCSFFLMNIDLAKDGIKCTDCALFNFNLLVNLWVRGLNLYVIINNFYRGRSFNLFKNFLLIVITLLFEIRLLFSAISLLLFFIELTIIFIISIHSGFIIYLENTW